jgi:hypothetical protein
LRRERVVGLGEEAFALHKKQEAPCPGAEQTGRAGLLLLAMGFIAREQTENEAVQ